MKAITFVGSRDDVYRANIMRLIMENVTFHNSVIISMQTVCVYYLVFVFLSLIIDSDSIADEYRRREGAVIIFSVWHYEPFLPNDFLGEVVLPLNGLRELNGLQRTDDLPAVMVPLRRPREPREGPYRVTIIMILWRNVDLVFALIYSVHR